MIKYKSNKITAILFVKKIFLKLLLIRVKKIKKNIGS